MVYYRFKDAVGFTVKSLLTTRDAVSEPDGEAETLVPIRSAPLAIESRQAKSGMCSQEQAVYWLRIYSLPVVNHILSRPDGELVS